LRQIKPRRSGAGNILKAFAFGIAAMARTGRLVLAASAVLAAAALVAMPFRSALRRPKKDASRSSIIANTAAGPIEYAEKGAGIPLLAIHGAGGGYDQGLAIVADFIGDEFRVIAPSRFGYLRTPVPADSSPTAQADAHAALLSELRIPKAVVVGISAGGPSAIELALRHPDRVAALILLVPGTYSPTSPVSIDKSRGSEFVFWLANTGADFLWWATEKLAPSVLVTFVGVKPALFAAASKTEQDRVMALVRSIQPLSARIAGINVDSNPRLHALALEKIAAPTLVISARDDLFNTAPAAEYAAGKIPGAKLIVYDTGGHLLVGRQDEVRKAVHDFLATVHLPAMRAA
jgi:pimeloyl-ACP methyl ester carboxylesterase